MSTIIFIFMHIIIEYDYRNHYGLFQVKLTLLWYIKKNMTLMIYKFVLVSWT